MVAQIRISISQQQLTLIDEQGETSKWSVSTAANGVGSKQGSGRTPLGRHQIKIKIGESAPENAVFVGRRATGEIYTAELAAAEPQRDWILTRILWLSGLESGVNRGGDVDTLRRYIYIHGTPDSEPMGIPKSHGCVRMRNADLLELFDKVSPGTLVDIVN